MRDYEELVKKLRDCRNMAVYSKFWWDITTEAADAIEELSKEIMELKILNFCCGEPSKEESNA